MGLTSAAKTRTLCTNATCERGWTARSRDEEGNSSIYLGTPRCWFPLC